jgi:hypothetical protein
MNSADRNIRGWLCSENVRKNVKEKVGWSSKEQMLTGKNAE